MSVLSDSRGNKNYLDLGDVSVYEAASSTVFFVGSAAAFSNFGVTIPTGGGSVINLSDILAQFSIPVLGTAVITYALAIVGLLLGYQIYDSASSYGRKNGFDFMGWINSIPTGLTIVTVGSLVTVVGSIFDISVIMDLVNQSLATQTGTIIVHTATYWSVSSQD